MLRKIWSSGVYFYFRKWWNEVLGLVLIFIITIHITSFSRITRVNRSGQKWGSMKFFLAFLICWFDLSSCSGFSCPICRDNFSSFKLWCGVYLLISCVVVIITYRAARVKTLLCVDEGVLSMWGNGNEDLKGVVVMHFWMRKSFNWEQLCVLLIFFFLALSIFLFFALFPLRFFI